MESIRRRFTTRFGMGLAAAVWLIASGAGMAFITRYSATPGNGGSPPDKWPTQTALVRAADKWTLLLFLHPRCPCSRATLRELELLLTDCQDELQTTVVFIKPTGVSEDWARTDLWRTAQQMRGAAAVLDIGAVEAQRFGAETSGTTLLYNPTGKLLFQGGLTKARGHSGDNAGRDAAVALARGTLSRFVRTPVYGCPLFDERCATDSHGREVPNE